MLPTDRCDSSDRRLTDEPAQPIERNDPLHPIDRHDPTLPIDSTDPADPMDSTESREAMDQRDVGILHDRGPMNAAPDASLTSMSALRTVLTGLSFGESPRRHDGRLFVSDWGPARSSRSPTTARPW